MPAFANPAGSDGPENLVSSVEDHIASTKNLMDAAEDFIHGKGDAKALTASAEQFVSSAETHISGAEDLVGGMQSHIGQLHTAVDSAEDHISKLMSSIGAEDKVAPKGQDTGTKFTEGPEDRIA